MNFRNIGVLVDFCYIAFVISLRGYELDSTSQNFTFSSDHGWCFMTIESSRFQFFRNGELVGWEGFTSKETLEVQLVDSSFVCEVELFSVINPQVVTTFNLFADGEQIASAGSVLADLDMSELDKLTSFASENIDDRREVFTHDHEHLPNNSRPRVLDGTKILKGLGNAFSQSLMCVPTRTEHTKLGYKDEDVSDLSELHLDRFGGMRAGYLSKRRRVNRYFINVGSTPRRVCFAIMTPSLVDKYMPDTYSTTYLDELLEKMDRKISVVYYDIPAPRGDCYFYCRYLSTHLFHCEYGDAPDASVLIISDTEARKEFVSAKF